MQTVDSTTVASLSTGDQIKNKIASLAEALQQRLPSYESLLHEIHRALSMYPDTVHLLEEDEIGVIVGGLQKKTGSFIAKEGAEKMVKSKGKKLDLEDLM